MKRAAVLPALGIGDGLLMMIASEQLKAHGYQVTTFHNALPQLSSWFPGHDLQTLSAEEKVLETLSSYDLILIENDNSTKVKHLIHHCRKRLSIFYPTYLSTKHAPLNPMDKVFDPNLPMADNIAFSIASLLQMQAPSKDNGLTPPSTLKHRCNKTQVLIHPTSRVPSKNWKASGFIQVAKKLAAQGLKPLFCVSPEEQKAWGFVQQWDLPLIIAPTLAHLAAIIYESGIVIGNDSLAGHLASNLHIPSVIIANDSKRMRLWRPGWLQGQLVLPPFYLPNWKFLRLKENHWQHFITPSKVLKIFDLLLQN